jgi:hypothetical protein
MAGTPAVLVLVPAELLREAAVPDPVALGLDAVVPVPDLLAIVAPPPDVFVVGEGPPLTTEEELEVTAAAAPVIVTGMNV